MKLIPWRKQEEVARGGWSYPISLDQYANLVGFGSNPYGLGSPIQTLRGEKQEEIGRDFGSLVAGAYKSNGVVFACVAARLLLFSEARFQFQQLNKGRPGSLFGNTDLAILEEPVAGHTTGDLLAQAELDMSFAGNWFGWRDGDQLHRLRPDWVTLVLGSKMSDEDASVMPDATVIGYVYSPGGSYSDYEPIFFDASEVAHYAPMRDPAARYRGMSWLQPVCREVMGDSAATAHKLKFFENGATSNAVVKVPEGVRKDAFDNLVAGFKEKHDGVANAYKTIFLTSGADMSVVGQNFQQMDFKITQGAGETRIAAAARVHPVIVGLSEGLQGSSLNAGNFQAARRLTADATMRPLWRNMAGSLQRIIKVPPGARLWYDDRDISFLQEDQKDAAEILQAQSVAIKTCVDAGYEQQSAVDAIVGNDLSLLKPTGLVSVQLQEPGANPNGNGNGNGFSKQVVMPPAKPNKLPAAK